ncbi:MAG: S41 family peptidase [Bacteroidales bacterium]|nr:S41 family peptidase [Bacteroidales bacterium]
MKSPFQYIALIFLFTTFACKKEIALTENEKTNQWIYNSLKHDYLFYKDIPATSSLNFNQDPESFFPILLSAQEKNNRNYYFSYIEKKKTTAKFGESKSTYGFEFQYYTFSGSISMAIRVIYVHPNSSAEKAGIKRGDWYYAINGVQIVKSDLEKFLSGGDIVLSKGKINTSYQLTPEKTVALAAATDMSADPIFLDSIFTINNTKVGYLIYNQFLTGPSGFSDKTYDTELKSVFSYFKSQQINKLILDLRFNGGGYISSCQLLCSMIVQSQNLGSLMAKQQYNDQITKERGLTGGFENLNFYNSKDIINQNVNLTELYIICSSATASASELVVNSLKPYMPVNLIGTKTVGKNLGSYEITSTLYNYILHPITLKLYNSAGESNYSDGFIPTGNNYINEYESGADFLPLGNTKELVLNRTLQIMGLSSFLKSTTVQNPLNGKIIPELNSVYRKGQNMIFRLE